METFYEACFCNDGSSYFFHSKDNAIKFIEEAYNDEYGSNIEDEIYMTDMKSLKQDGYIEDYAWIYEVNFEDEK